MSKEKLTPVEELMKDIDDIVVLDKAILFRLALRLTHLGYRKVEKSDAEVQY